MKKLLPIVFSLLAVVSTRADLIFYEGFDYADGPIIVVSTNLAGTTTNWFRHSGTASPSDSIVANHKLQISASSPGILPRTDDVNRPFTSATNATQVVYGSLTVNCTNLPPAVGTYFAHFFVNGTTFNGRVFAQAGTLPGTWRLGVSGAANTVSKVYPVDLATNVDYQVVIYWDPVTTFGATLWVNPISSADPSVTSIDSVTSPGTIKGFGFRQAGTFGSFFANITNLATATTFDEAATNVWSTNAVAPIIVYSPKTGTNFVGDAVNLSAVAAGQGIGSLIYQWQKDGADVANPNGNSNVFSIASAVAGDTGNYRMIATTPYNLSVTSTVAFLWVTNAPVPPTVIPTTNSTIAVSYHQATSLHVVASGPPTITYAWYYNNGPLGPNASGDGTDTLAITDVFTNNGTTGTYYCVASNPFGNKTSGVFTVTAVAPPAVSIAYLRTLVDPVNYVATNSNLRWQATGVVTTSTNLTTANTSSYYLQDSTAGINIFVTLGSTFRPAQGDVITFVGWLSSFNSTLELEADATDPSTSYTVLSNNIALLPDPLIVPFSITNNLAFTETNLEGRIVMLTNVYFGTNAGTVLSTTANSTVLVTNDSGGAFTLFFTPQDLDTAGQTLPSFANTVVGPLTQNLGNGVTPRDQGYSVTVTRFSDIVTNPLTIVPGTPTITWTAAPVSYAYSVWGATDVTGPYAVLTNHLHLSDANGTYTDPDTSSSQKFYRLSTP